jgi:hypothetical protein
MFLCVRDMHLQAGYPVRIWQILLPGESVIPLMRHSTNVIWTAMFLDVIERVNDQGCGGLEIERANVVQGLEGGFCL